MFLWQTYYTSESPCTIFFYEKSCKVVLYNDKPLKKHLLIQTISRVNRKYPGKEYGMVIDYIGIRDNMREAMTVSYTHLTLPTKLEV